MSPEQAMGDTDNIGPAADIHSLGVICYEMLAGCVPFEGNVTAVLTKIATQEPKPLSEYDLAIGLTLVAIVSRRMAKQASDRYESMGAVVKALTDYLQDYTELDSERESDTAPHMELISLCVQIEQRLRELVNRNGLRDRGTAKRYLEDLGRADALQTSSMNDLRQFVGIANRAIHGAEIKPNSADGQSNMVPIW